MILADTVKMFTITFLYSYPALLVGQTSSRLVIDSLSQADVANYACNASNSAGYEYKNVIVNILTVSARITRGPPKELLVSRGSLVMLPCEVEGHPRPSVTWRKDGAA